MAHLLAHAFENVLLNDRPDGLGSDDLVRRELFVHRLAGASAAAVDCARAGSVLGLRFHPADATRLAELSTVDGTVAIDGLHRGRVLRAMPDGLVEFMHPLFRQVVYDDLPAATRLRLNAAAFALLAGRGSEAEAAEHAILGRHDGDPAAIAVLGRIEAEAAAVGATRTAAHCLTGAYRLAGSRANPTLAVAAADALLAVGQPAAAVALFYP